MQTLRAALAAAAILVLCANDTQADWWPFGKSDDSPPASSRPGDSWWKLKSPNVGRSSSRQAQAPRDPGMLEVGLQKTTRAIGNTASALNPFRYLPKKKSEPLPVTGRNLHERKTKSSGFGSWFSREERTPPPSTPSEWMKQGRPRFD